MLPEIQTSRHVVNLPSTGEKIEFRPFLVKEEKILHMAKEGNDSEQMASALIDVLQNCILSEDVDVKKLPSFDAQFIFLKLRSKSVGEVLDFKLKCDNEDCRTI